MKPSVLHTLMVAKAIFAEVKALVNLGDKHSSTAAIILLQDSIELVVLASLNEIDADEQRSLESKSFDQLLGELKKHNLSLYKSGTIKALNKQRVISKHYGQLAEPASVANYFDVALKFTDNLLQQVIGKGLIEVFLVDVLAEGAIKTIIKTSIETAENKNYLDALIQLRMAFYLAYENQYCVYGFRDRDSSDTSSFGFLGLAMLGGRKAPYWTRNKQWIEENVKKPLDYVQMNYDQLKTDCMEYGVSTVDVENFRRLTPQIVQSEKDVWHHEYTTALETNELTVENFNFCLDLLINFLLKKQELEKNVRHPRQDAPAKIPTIYVDKQLYKSPSTTSEVVGAVNNKHFYSISETVFGFDPKEKYYRLHLYPQSETDTSVGHVFGYMLVE